MNSRPWLYAIKCIVQQSGMELLHSDYTTVFMKDLPTNASGCTFDVPKDQIVPPQVDTVSRKYQ